MASITEKSTDEAIEFVSKSLTMVDEVMSDEEARVENATVDCELNDTSGFGSAEHYTDIMAMTVAHLGRNNEDSRDRRSIDVLVASNASMLDGDERDNEFLDEAGIYQVINGDCRSVGCVLPYHLSRLVYVNYVYTLDANYWLRIDLYWVHMVRNMY